MSGQPASRLPRLVACDVDGTLLRSDHSLAPRTAAALDAARRAGVVTAIATGRPYFVVGELRHHVDWVVSANGALVTHVPSGETPYEITFPYEHAVEFVTEARRRVDDLRFSMITDEHLGWEAGFEAFSPPGALPGERVDDVLAAVPGREVHNLVAYHPVMGPHDLAPLLAGIVPTLTAEHRGFHGVEVVPGGIDKALALDWLARHLGVDTADVWAFGDGVNDLDMLRWAGHGVAMANADERALAVADEVAPSNDDDGVAAVLERVVAQLGSAGSAP